MSTQALTNDGKGLNVGLVTETYPPEVNGVAMTLGKLVKGLLSMGNHVELYRPRQDVESDEHTSPAFSQHLVRGLHIPMYKDMQLGMPAGKYFKKIWSEKKPDVLYVATEGPLGWSAIKIAKQLNIPVLSGFHTNFQAYSKHYKLGWISPIVFKYLRHLHNKTYCTITPTEDMVDLLRSNGFKRAEVMQRGVDLEQFNPGHRSAALRQTWGVEPDERVCLYVGRIAAEKNIREAVNAVRALKQKKDIKFVLVGDGPLKEKLAKENPDFIFAGTKRGVELSRHYASCDLFLFPSHTETYGNVVTEAMASGLAVVAFNKAAAKQHINDWQNGVLVNDDDSFSHKTEQLVNKPELINKIGAEAANYSRGLDWKQINIRFEQLLREAVDSNAENSTAASSKATYSNVTGLTR